MAEIPQRETDIGPPHYEKMLPPVIKANYGKWKYHERIKPGVMVHVGESGDKAFTVRAASPRLVATVAAVAVCPGTHHAVRGELSRVVFLIRYLYRIPSGLLLH